MKKIAIFFGVLVLVFVLLSSNSVTAAPPFGGIGRWIGEVIRGFATGFTNLFTILADAIGRHGLNFDEVQAEVGTQVVCEEDFPMGCGGEYGLSNHFLVHYRWIAGCYDDGSVCCQMDLVNCRDPKWRHDKENCEKYECTAAQECESDADCEHMIVCPNELNGGTIETCDTEFKRCYCAGFCGDGHCDYDERTRQTCDADCGVIGDDNDSDGLSDDNEDLSGTDPENPESDGDGLEDAEEVFRGSDPLDPDTDDGGQCDGYNEIPEVCRAGPDPCLLDSSNLCYLGVQEGDTPYNTDIDGDDISNGVDPCPVDPMNNCELGNDPEPTFGDLLPDEEPEEPEEPMENDTDGDGMPDDWEEENGVDDPYTDDDSDGLTNLEEYILGIDPNNPDTDGDGILDGEDEGVPGLDSKLIIRLLDVKGAAYYHDDEIYRLDFGDTIEEILVDVAYDNGKPVIKARVTGLLIARNSIMRVPLEFQKTIYGYSANTSYDVLKKNNEGPFIELVVEAEDLVFGVNGTYRTRLLLFEEDESFYVTVVSPSQKDKYRYGEIAKFEVTIDGTLAKEVETANVMIYVDGTNREFSLKPWDNNSYVADYEITSDDLNPASFLVYALGTAQGKIYQSAAKIKLDLNPSLIVSFVLARPNESIKTFDVVYSNSGERVSDDAVLGTLNDQHIVLKRDPFGYFSGRLVTEASEDILGFIEDVHGNRGDVNVTAASIQQPEPEEEADVVGLILSLMLFLLVAVIIFFIYRRYKKRMEEETLKEFKEDELIRRKEQLKRLIKRTRVDFYKRRITEEAANKSIAGYEDELRQIKDSLSSSKK